MAIVFPASPSTNDTFTAGSITYKWDGAKWIGLGVTPTDRLIEGSNSLEITAGNELVWTGGKVGVNQVTPIAILHAKSGANDGTLVSTFEGATNNKLNIRFDTFGPVLDVTAGDPLAFEIGGSEKMRLDGDGHLQIRREGVASVSGTDTRHVRYVVEQSNGQEAIVGSVFAQGKSSWGGDLVFASKQATGNPSTGLTETMRLNAAGHLTIPYQPRFLAYGNSSSPQTTSGTFTWDTFTTHRFNVGSHFSTTTKAFTAPTAGCYAFGCNCRIDSGDIGYFRIILSVNSSANDTEQGHSIRNADTASGSFHSQSITALYELNAGDTVKVLVEANSDSTWVMHSESQFWGYMVG